jgi:hypothetical protein
MLLRRGAYGLESVRRAAQDSDALGIVTISQGASG